MIMYEGTIQTVGDSVATGVSDMKYAEYRRRIERLNEKFAKHNPPPFSKISFTEDGGAYLGDDPWYAPCELLRIANWINETYGDSDD